MIIVVTYMHVTTLHLLESTSQESSPYFKRESLSQVQSIDKKNIA